MKKKYFVIILIMILFLTCGCTKINNYSDEDLILQVLEQSKVKSNVALNGYKIYMPVGMILLNDAKSNNILYSEGEKYYLYVDLLSYYNKSETKYSSNDTTNTFLYKNIDYNGKKGYVSVLKKDEQYFLEVVYNYGKIEVLTSNYRQAIVKAITVLNSIEYNNNIVESMVGTNILDYSEEEYTLKQPDGITHDSSLKYDGEYVDTENELPDEDIIKVQTH